MLLVRERRLLERLRVGHRDVGARDAANRGVEVVEGLLLDQRREVRADAAEVGAAAQLEALLRPALDGESPTFRWPLPDGSELEVSAAPVRDRRAGVIGVMTVARRVVAERARTRGAGAAVRL